MVVVFVGPLNLEVNFKKRTLSTDSGVGGLRHGKVITCKFFSRLASAKEISPFSGEFKFRHFQVASENKLEPSRSVTAWWQEQPQVLTLVVHGWDCLTGSHLGSNLI